MRAEREQAAALVRQYGHTPLDPISGEYTTLDGNPNVQDDESGLTMVEIYRKDMFAITRLADAVVWLTGDTPSYGSCIEIGLAAAHNIPVLVVSPAGRGARSAFVAALATHIGPSLEEVLQWLNRYMIFDTTPAPTVR